MLVVVQVLYGLQQRTRDGAITDAARLRQIAGQLRRLQPVSLERLDLDGRGEQHKVLRCFARHVQRAFLDPETERVKDVWDLAAFGLRGHLTFTKISQGWLREAAKRWAADDLPRRRGKDAPGPVRHYLVSLAALSDSLRATRPDRGEQPGVLGRSDIEAFLRRLAFLAAEGRVSVDARTRICREVRHLLGRFRALGLARTGAPAAGLGDDFALAAGDTPSKPEDPEPNRDLPSEILRQLCEHLPTLEQPISCREVRVAVELIIDTGRRPDEICALRWDCLEYDEDRSPVLVYDNHKNARLGRRRDVPVGLDQADAESDGVRWLGPFPTASWPVERVELRESVELAFAAALQHLPPRRRAVLLLRDVLGYSARETAEMLNITPTAAHSALQHARSSVTTRVTGTSQQRSLRALGDAPCGTSSTGTSARWRAATCGRSSRC